MDSRSLSSLNSVTTRRPDSTREPFRIELVVRLSAAASTLGLTALSGHHRAVGCIAAIDLPSAACPGSALDEIVVIRGLETFSC
jgi:hypothetical protein